MNTENIELVENLAVLLENVAIIIVTYVRDI